MRPPTISAYIYLLYNPVKKPEVPPTGKSYMPVRSGP